MFFALVLLPLFVFASGESQDNLSPNCDLIDAAYISILHNAQSLNVQFAWDRKNQNYAKLNGSVKSYVVRHGPVQNGQLSNDAHLVIMKPNREDTLLIKNVKPVDQYGIQLCALTNNSGDSIDDDVWQNRAWIGKFNFSSPDSIEGHKLKFEYNNFLPKCNLVAVSYIGVTEDLKNHTFTVSIAWDKKLSSYQNLTHIDHYRVRYGRQESWGMPIKESDAHYMDAPANETEIEIPGVTRDFYGVQICAMESGENSKLDWQKEAWLGSMDFTPAPIPIEAISARRRW